MSAWRAAKSAVRMRRPLLGDLPAVGARNLGDEAMGVQQGQASRDLGSLGALLLFVLGLAKEQQLVYRGCESLSKLHSPRLTAARSWASSASKGLSDR